MELFAKPGVAGIIEKTVDGLDYILTQERFKEDAPNESGPSLYMQGKREYSCEVG